jgi:hypothetical protein
MAEEYTQYTFNLPGGEQSIQTALSLDDAKQKALDWYRRNGYSVPDLSSFTEKPADASYYRAMRLPMPSAPAPTMAPTGPVEQKMAEPEPFIEPPAATPPPAPTPPPTAAETIMNDPSDVFQPVDYTRATVPQPAISEYTQAQTQGPRSMVNPYMAAAPNLQPLVPRPNVQRPPLPQVPAPQPSGMGIMGQLPQSSGPVLRAPSNAFSQDYAGFLTKRN